MDFGLFAPTATPAATRDVRAALDPPSHQSRLDDLARVAHAVGHDS